MKKAMAADLPSLVWFHDGNHEGREEKLKLPEDFVVSPSLTSSSCGTNQHRELPATRQNDKQDETSQHGDKSRFYDEWRCERAGKDVFRAAAGNVGDGDCTGMYGMYRSCPAAHGLTPVTVP
jgi:hypothetical protein